MNITNLPTESLLRIAPYVEKLTQNGFTPENPDKPLTEEQLAMRKIVREVSSQQPPVSMAEAKSSLAALRAARRERWENGEKLGAKGDGGLWSFDPQSNVLKWMSHDELANERHQRNLNILTQLREKIESLRAQGIEIPVGTALDISG